MNRKRSGSSNDGDGNRSGLKGRSLVRQIAIIVALAQVLCAVGLSLATLYHERWTRLRALDAQVRGRSDSLLGAIQDAEDPEANLTIDPAELKLPRFDTYAVYDAAGRVIGTSGNVPRELAAPGAKGMRSVRAGGASYRLFQRSALRIIDRSEHGGVGLRRPVTILYASPEGHVWHEVLEAASYSVAAILLAAACTVALVLLLLRRALHPLADLADEAGRIDALHLHFETPASVARVNELRQLGAALTTTVNGLRAAFDNEKRFLGDAAHELKTAIAVVRSSVQVLLLRDRTPAEYQAGLDRALTDNERVEELVEQMLRLSSMEGADEGPFSVDLATTARLVCTRLEPLAAMHGVQLLPELSSACMVRLPAERAAALVSNLLTNAIHHSPAGSEVRLCMVQQGGSVQMEVRDHGRGIGPAALPHIFERFYREDASRSRETGGTGLGLSICKAIVDHAHGTIQVRSQRGAGTTFTVTFTQA